jgi:hypothetical protein
MWKTLTDERGFIIGQSLQMLKVINPSTSQSLVLPNSGSVYVNETLYN